MNSTSNPGDWKWSSAENRCRYCGVEIVPGYSLCWNCSKPLDDYGENTLYGNYEPGDLAPESAKGSGKMILALVILFLLGLYILIYW